MCLDVSLVLGIPFPFNNDSGYMLWLVLAILKLIDRDCGYMFRLVQAIL